MSYEEDTEQMPERVYVDPDIRFPECEKQYGCDVEYVRGDLFAAALAREKALKDSNQEARSFLRHKRALLAHITALETKVARYEAALDWCYSGDGLDSASLMVERLIVPFSDPVRPNHAIQVAVRAMIDKIKARAALSAEDVPEVEGEV